MSKPPTPSSTIPFMIATAGKPYQFEKGAWSANTPGNAVKSKRGVRFFRAGAASEYRNAAISAQIRPVANWMPSVWPKENGVPAGV